MQWVSYPLRPTMSRTFHSLFKVLFIFRSHYLFAIGLGEIFSLRRSTPAVLDSILKLPDSWEAERVGRSRRMVRDDSPRWLLVSERFIRLIHPCSTPLHYNSGVSDSIHTRLWHRLLPIHSQLLRESQLFSCPPLNDMLKFSGFSCIAEVRERTEKKARKKSHFFLYLVSNRENTRFSYFNDRRYSLSLREGKESTKDRAGPRCVS